MAKKRRQFHCQHCTAPCEIYRKGKAHRVLVCPNCGVLATNPTVVGKVARRAGRALLGEIPGASLVMEAAGAVKDLKSKEPPQHPKTRAASSYSLDKVKLALGG